MSESNTDKTLCGFLVRFVSWWFKPHSGTETRSGRAFSLVAALRQKMLDFVPQFGENE
jgi:hypothetical protein